jgi:hypothetical protein
MNALQSITEFAKARDVTPRTVNNWLQANRLPGARKVDGKWLIPSDAELAAPPRDAVATTSTPAPVPVAAPAYAVPVFMPKRRPIPIDAVAAEFGVPAATIRRWAKAGEGGLSLSTGPTGAHFVWIEAAG